MSKVVSLGIHIVDVLGRPVSEAPKGQGLALLDLIRFTVAGTAAGTAIDMAKLDLEVLAMGAIGQDEIGDFLVATMQRFGVNTTHLVRKSQAQTSCTMLPIRPNGERPALHVIGANGELTIDDIHFEAIAAAQFLHVGGTPLMLQFDGQPASQVLKTAKQQGVTTTFDLLGIPRSNLPELIKVCLPHVDFFTPNYEEAVMICGLSSIDEILRCFLDQGARHVVIRLGEKGSAIGWLENGILNRFATPAFEVPVIDSTGCGDAYNAGFIKGLSLGWEFEECCRLGCPCGGLVIQGLGSDAGIENFDQVMSFAQKTKIKKAY
jgi:sugar/nucleoside kinase (ribokinase family)